MKKGEHVINVALADRILYDHRVPPKGFQIEQYAFYIPKNAAAPLKVKATLKYRSASQALTNILLGDSAPKMPVVDMAVVEETIELE